MISMLPDIKYIRRFCMAAVAIVLLAALSACHDGWRDEPEVPSDEGGMLSIGFKVAAPSSAQSGEADGSGGYEDGTNLESAIDFASHNYRVYFFDKEGVYLVEWDQVADVHVVKTSDYWIYTFTGKVPAKLGDYNKECKDFSVMVLANWPDYPEGRRFRKENKTISDFVTAEWAKFKAFDIFELSCEDHRLIPLYGLGKYTDITLSQDAACDLGTVRLLRAMAKVEVNLSGLPDGVTIEGNPVVKGVNPGGFCAPQGEYGTGNNWNTDYVPDLHLPFGANQNHAEAMNNSAEMLKVGNENKWIAYLPEYRNVGQADYSRIEMKLSYKEEPFVLNFARYDADGQPDNENGRFDIRRNDLYRFNVAADIHAIKFRLSVEPWIEGGRTEIDFSESTE